MRKLQDWIKSYMDWSEDTEPAKVFHLWTALTTISGALQKKVSLSLGRLNIYPNIYTVFVAEPGIARKSQAINMGLGIINRIPSIHTSPDATTPQALLDAIQAATEISPGQGETALPDGRTQTHASMLIVAKEFETFLGQKKENNKMLVMLTDLFDAQELPFKYRTKHSGSNDIPSVYLSMLGATTPESLASSLPPTAIGGGLTSRMMFVWADGKYKKCPQPEKTPEIKELEEDLVNDLHLISIMDGAYKFSPDCSKKWDEWYYKYEELDPRRLCKDPSFNGWYSRKPMYILKIATIIAASRSSSFVMHWEYIAKAMEYIDVIEGKMNLVFRAVGRSSITTDVDELMKIVAQRKFVKEKELLSMTWRNLDSRTFDNAINTAIRTGAVLRRFVSPNGEQGDIWYYDAEFWLAIEEKLRIPSQQPYTSVTVTNPNKKEIE